MHENDGLIFTIDKCPYYPDTCHDVIKWKPPHMNSVDFELKFICKYQHETKDNIWGLYVKDGKQLKLFDFFVFPSNLSL